MATTNLSILCVAILSWLEVAVVKGAAFSSLWLKFEQVIFVSDRKVTAFQNFNTA